MPSDDRCECQDPNCPVCHGKCRRKQYSTLYRVDMEDLSGTGFCRECSEDAFNSGLFSDCSPDEMEEYDNED